MENTTDQKIINHYMDTVLTNENPLKSIYQFCKEIEIEENEFYQHFNSFEILEEEIFSKFHSHAIELIKKEASYAELDNQNKLTTYYYTIFEIFNANRSYILWSLNTLEFKQLKKLKSFKKHFISFIDSLSIEKIDFKKDNLNKIQDKGFHETLWVQFITTLKFWIDDSSKGFEKTDLFIEKSLSVSFKLIKNNALKDIIDFGKFFFKEKIKPQL